MSKTPNGTESDGDAWGDDVDGPREIDPGEFEPTDEEWAVLARYHMDNYLDIKFCDWVYGTSSSSPRAHIWDRIEVAKERLGAEGLDAALAPVEEKWRRRFDELRQHGVRCEECGCLQKAPEDWECIGECAMHVREQQCVHEDAEGAGRALTASDG